jgi:flagellar basal body rod protein FlgG
MGSFDQGLSGMVSLRAVNEWIGVLNSNLGGSNRTAYKSTKISFGGGVAQVLRDPRAEANGIEIPDSTLTISSTRIDFNQGTIIQDGELTHMAISGDGFFAVTDGTNIFYTRDGDFRWSVLNSQTILTTAGGLTVLSSPQVASIPLSHSPYLGSTDPATDFISSPFAGLYLNGYDISFLPVGGGSVLPGGITAGTHYFVVNSTGPSFQISNTPGGPPIDITSAEVGTYAIRSDPQGLIVSDSPSTTKALSAILRIGSGATFSVTDSTVTGANLPVGVFRFPNNQALKFSKYGSTIFDSSNALSYGATPPALAAIPPAATDVEIIQSALESSNAALNDTLPELSLAQKLFSAVSKIINVHNSDLDLVINLIR